MKISIIYIIFYLNIQFWALKSNAPKTEIWQSVSLVKPAFLAFQLAFLENWVYKKQKK